MLIEALPCHALPGRAEPERQQSALLHCWPTLLLAQLPSRRGVDIPPAEVAYVPAACALASSPHAGAAGPAGCAPQRAHSAAALVPLPIPDFSMPFNVACFTSTLLAVFLGGVLNALLRRVGVVR